MRPVGQNRLQPTVQNPMPNDPEHSAPTPAPLHQCPFQSARRLCPRCNSDHIWPLFNGPTSTELGSEFLACSVACPPAHSCMPLSPQGESLHLHFHSAHSSHLVYLSSLNESCSLLTYLLTEWPWVSQLTSLSRSFLFLPLGMMVSTFQGCCLVEIRNGGSKCYLTQCLAYSRCSVKESHYLGSLTPLSAVSGCLLISPLGLGLDSSSNREPSLISWVRNK